MDLNQALTERIRRESHAIVGFADLRRLSAESRQNFDRGILIGLTYSAEAMRENLAGRPRRYFEEYSSINRRLPGLAQDTARFLVERGCKALPKVASAVAQDADRRTVLPHKTVATLAGVGWIGKCALLVTPEAGSALRLVVVLTDAPLVCGTPVTRSRCPAGCTVCADACPGHAPLGGQWAPEVDRSVFFDAEACRNAARARAGSLLDIDETVCGLCAASCPVTRGVLGY
ncbi:MAG: epoxyqueuosine reductase [Clostridia bacterium]|nr:epoxyqueuosine reductase [Clostridia bacterium]